jgi:dienelactone hydrolase
MRTVSRALAGLVVTGLAVTCSATVALGADVQLPAVTGMSAVGRVELALTDADRRDPFATDGRARELAVWLWNPAAEGSSGAPAPYLPPTWADLINGAGILSTDLHQVGTRSIADAPLDGRPPVVVLQPGLGQPVAIYTALAEELASHGYAVVGINPTESALVVFPDGHVVPPAPAGDIDLALLSDVPGWYDAAARIAAVWVADAAFVVESLAADPPTIGALDFDRVAYLGHSMGGATAFEACHRDARCSAAVDLDGTLWTEVRHTGLRAPNLVIRHDQAGACNAFCEAADADFAAVKTEGGSEQYAITGSQHQDFTDLGLLRGPDDALPLGPIEPERMTVITRDLVRSFLDEYVRGTPAAFAEAVGRYPEVG